MLLSHFPVSNQLSIRHRFKLLLHSVSSTMIDIRKLKSIFNITQNHLLLKPTQNPRFHSTKRALRSESPDSKPSRKPTMKEAQARAALLEYLHSTRSLPFSDAENMCKNSPFFLRDLLKKTQNDAVSRYLRYHPINEFEPFFESAGLKPSEYLPLIPRGKIFLADDPLLMENYRILCNYGIPRTKMGKIFKETPQVFRYESGVLISKLQAYEKMGVEHSVLVVFVASSPSLLVGDANFDFVKVVEKLKGPGIKDGDWNWIEGYLSDVGSFNWGLMLELLCFLAKFCSDEQWVDLFKCFPFDVFEDSGGRTLSLIAFLSKFGLSLREISLMILEFPRIQVGEFFSNLRQCYLFLNEIGMQAAEIGKIFRSHSLFLGSFTLKRTNSLLSTLCVGKKHLCTILQDNPLEMKNWALGRKVEPLMSTAHSKMMKTEFLLSLGYVENSEEMNKAFKLFKGKGAEIQERFNLIVKAGLDCEDARKMVKICPRILTQSIDRISMKIDFLVNEGYPVSELVNFPSFLCYEIRRVKFRLSMYNWLKDHGAADSRFCLSTIIATSDKGFIQQYVNRHPSGLQVWQDLKAEIYSEV